jgi:hypothetical protein
VGALPLATRTLGVPAPASAAVVISNADGTSANTETRAVTYTYVNTKGDESAPATPTEVVCKTDDTLTASALAAAPGGFDINRIRLYMTVSGQSGDAEFFFQKEVGSGTASTTITTKSTAEVMQTTGWLPPPADLANLTAMWNGMLAGITNGRVRVCEAFKPYAWKIENDFPPPDASAVALGRVGEQSLLVLTTGRPAIMTGTSPDSLDLQPLEIAEACIAPRAVVGFGHGVAWPCEDGLAYYGAGGAKMLTAGLFLREDWQALNPSGMVAASYEGAYLAFYTDAGAVRRGLIIDPLNPTGVYFLDRGYDALWFDELQDALFVYDAATGDVKKWDAGAALMTATHRSGQIVTPPANFGWARVEADAYPVTVRIDAGPFAAGARTALLAARANLTATGADSVRFTKVVADEKPFRLPDGFEATRWQVQVETAAGGVQPPVVLATDPAELP